jgi:D-arabinose 1-dehydrogenase-like Zn-dependent alcohol dehydrogenase
VRAQQIVAWGEALQERELPTPVPQGAEVLLRVQACGVCHSDVHIRDGFFDMGGGRRLRLDDIGLRLPFTMGHEIVGECVATGPEATGVALGTKYVVYPWIGCGKCDVCRAGLDNHCMAPRILGTRVPGGFATHVLCPDPKYLIGFGSVPAELACTYACSGLTAYAALKKVRLFGGSPYIVVIGAGGVGLSAIHIARALLPAKIIAADVDEKKRAAAKDAGAEMVIDNRSDTAIQKVKEVTNGGAVAVLDFVGAPKTVSFGLDVLRKCGQLILIGLFGDALSVPLARLPLLQLSIQGSLVGTLNDMVELMDHVKAGKISRLPYRTRPLSEANAALDDLVTGSVVGRTVLKVS